MSGKISLVLVGILLCSSFIGFAGRVISEDSSSEETFKPTRIALIDMAKVFKNSEFFDESRNKLKEEILEAQAAAKPVEVELKSLIQKLSRTEKGSEEYAELTTQINRKKMELDELRRPSQALILKHESEFYHETYRRIAETVEGYSRTEGIELVIRFSSDPLNKNTPEELIKGMNSFIVFHNELDITDKIIELINQPAN